MSIGNFSLMNIFESDFNVKSAECAGYFGFFTVLKTEKTILNHRIFYN
jgi:hypothetical protein